MQKIILLVTVVIIIAMAVKIYRRKLSYNDRSTVIEHEGIKVSGFVAGVKPKTSFDHDRNERGRRIDMRIKYTDPYTSVEKIIDFYTTVGMPGLHPYVLSASGYIDAGALGGAIRAVKEHRKELINQGLQGKELKAALKEFSLKMSENPSSHVDSTGYVVFDKNIPVNVYVLPQDNTNERKIQVEFLYDPKNNSDLYKVD